MELKEELWTAAQVKATMGISHQKWASMLRLCQIAPKAHDDNGNPFFNTRGISIAFCITPEDAADKLAVELGESTQKKTRRSPPGGKSILPKEQNLTMKLYDSTTTVSTAEVAILPFENPTPEQFGAALNEAMIYPRYNTRNNRRQVWFVGKGVGWEDVTDVISHVIRRTLANTHLPLNIPDCDDVVGVVDVSAAKFNDVFSMVCATNAVDPFMEYLLDLPPWDGMPRVTAWLDKCFEVADESFELAEWASMFTFLGAVWRTFMPGCKIDEMPVLIGKGGIGKSTALRYILPPELRDMFSDGLNLGAQAKEKVETLQGKLIIEAAEMQGVRRADMESLKSFLSRTDDGSVRLAYRHDPEPMPRKCIIVGTADHPDPLPDDSNLRRFVPITLLDGDVQRIMNYMDDIRHQLWAEAVWMYQNGHHARLPNHLKPNQSEATEAARAGDTALEDSITRYLDAQQPDIFTTEQVAIGIAMVDMGKSSKLSVMDSRRIAQVLRHKGYAYKVRRISPERTGKRWGLDLLPE